MSIKGIKVVINLTAKQKQRLILGGIIVIIIAVAMIITIILDSPQKEKKKTQSAQEKRKMSILTEKVEKDLWVAAESHNIKSIEQSNEALKTELEKLQAELKELKDKQIMQESNKKALIEPKNQAGRDKASAKNYPDSSLPPPFPGDMDEGQDNENKRAKKPTTSTSRASQPASNLKTSPQSMQSIRVFIDEKEKEKEKGKKNEDDKKKPTEKKTSVWLPSGSFMKAVLLSGMDAPTSGGSPSEPYPILMSVKDLTTLPNLHKMNLRECFIIGAGYGNISDERAYIRTETLSCVKSDGKAIDIKLSGHVLGEDGKLGIRGRLVSKQGQQIAMSIFAGTLGGLGNALRPQQAIAVNVDPNKQTALQPNFSDIVEGAGMTGAGNALNKVADHYLKMAERLFPVIEIDAGREVEIVVLKGQELY
jgi:conjugal transfer pilus assembly protein TraB